MESHLAGAQLSSMFQHNSHPTTDKLYDPLRQVIKSRHFNSQSRISYREKIDSVLSRYIRDLSHEDTSKILESTFIPINKKLKATNHIQKVEGKSMVAIDHQVRMGDPISEEEMKSRLSKGGGKTEHIVYELDNSQARNKTGVNWVSKHKDLLGGKNKDLIGNKSLKSIDKNVESRLYVVNKNGNHDEKQQKEDLESTKPINQNNSQIDQTKKFSQHPSVRYIDKDTAPVIKSLISNKLRKNLNKNPSSPTNARSLRSKTLVKAAQQQYVSRYRHPPMKEEQSRNKPTYNMFSIIDEPINIIREKGCGGWTCPANQCIASKIKNKVKGWGG